MLLIGSLPSLGADTTSQEAVSYQRLPIYQIGWPKLDAQIKEVTLPATQQGREVLLHLEWSSNYDLVFRLGSDPAPSIFLKLPEGSSSGIALERQGQLAWFRVQEDKQLEAIAIRSTYSSGNTRYFTQTEERWTVCVVELPTDGHRDIPKSHRTSCQETPVDTSSFVWQQQYAPEARWTHEAVDTEGERGFQTVSIPLLRDHDGDGYSDLVFWRRFEVSREAMSEEAEPQEAPSFGLDRDELWLMRYVPESHSFFEPILISGPAPDLELATYHELSGSL